MALTAGDPLWYYKVLGLHCDGTNGSTTFTDVKGKTVTANGNAQISTAQYPALTGKTSSGYFDGSGDYLSIADSADWDFGTGDFFVRLRARFSSHTSNMTLVGNYQNTTTGWAVQRRSDTNTIRFGNGDTALLDVSWTPTDGVWYVIEVQRSGTSLLARVDGTQVGSTATNSTNITGSTNSLLVGSLFAGSYIYPYHGYISEIEVYKGAAPYPSNYTPSSDPFGDEYVSVSGTTKDANGNFASRLVRVYRRDTGALVGQTVSHPTTGAYKVLAPNSGTTTPLKHVAYVHDASDESARAPFRVLGLHCDGTNGSTTFTDVTGKTVTAVGNAQISTAQYPALTGKTSSCYLDGVGDNLSLATSTDWNMGSGDFCLAARVRPSTTSNTNQHIISLRDTGGITEIRLYLTSGRVPVGAIYHSGGYAVNITGTNALAVDTWCHIAFTRLGNVHSLRVNGASEGSSTVSHTIPTATLLCSIGYVGALDDNYRFKGYLSEVEIYKGAAPYANAYTPSSAPFPNAIAAATENALIYDDITPA